MNDPKRQAIALFDSRQLAAACDAFERLCQASPRDVESWIYLVQIHAQLGQPVEVERCCRAILRCTPTSDEAHYHLGYALLRQGKLERAAAAFRDALRHNPGHALALLQLGRVCFRLQEVGEALDHFRAAVRLRPDFAEAHSAIGGILEYFGDIDGSVRHFRRALEINPRLVAARIGLGASLMHLGQYDEVAACCRMALDQQLGHPEALALAADVAHRKGDAEEALRLLAPLLDGANVPLGAALIFADISGQFGRRDEAIGMLERLLAADPDLPAASRLSLHFQLGKLYDAADDYDRAFDHYRQGNSLKPASFDRQRHQHDMQAISEVFSADLMGRMPRATVRSERPVFVVGMVRSGTSLVEQIIASHPAADGAGELPDIIRTALGLRRSLGSAQRYPHCVPLLTQDRLDRLATAYLGHLATLSADALRVVDKMPGNYVHLGLIELLFPDARVIHCRRDPLDTCLSAYFQDFSQSHLYSFDLANLGACYQDYRRLMEHWRAVLTLPMLEVQYEELVSDQEGVSRRLIEFCGLEWDDRCLDFHRTRRDVVTASYDQVRRPMYERSVGRWRHYERHLGPLRDALRDA